jgi:hypothetical protein
LGSVAEFLANLAPLMGLAGLLYAWMVDQSVRDIRVGSASVSDLGAKLQEVVSLSPRRRGVGLFFLLTAAAPLLMVAFGWRSAVAAVLAAASCFGIISFGLSSFGRAQLRAAIFASESDGTRCLQVARAGATGVACAVSALTALGMGAAFLATLRLAGNASVAVGDDASLRGFIGIVCGWLAGACGAAVVFRDGVDVHAPASLYTILGQARRSSAVSLRLLSSDRGNRCHLRPWLRHAHRGARRFHASRIGAGLCLLGGKSRLRGRGGPRRTRIRWRSGRVGWGHGPSPRLIRSAVVSRARLDDAARTETCRRALAGLAPVGGQLKSKQGSW